MGFGAASADSSDDLAQAGAFGFDEATHVATIATAAAAPSRADADTGTSGQQLLAMPSTRDISAGFAMIGEREAAEGARTQAENAAALERVENAKAMQGVTSKPANASGTDAANATGPAGSVAQSGATSGQWSAKRDADNVISGVEQIEGAKTLDELDEYDLLAVDWTVGKKAFVEGWAARIDTYLKGTPLEGYGSVFAEAAWENGVDPRWSPAISNTESGNGTHCFLPHNAWGWGDDAWSDWETAIRAHVAGLAAGYGYSVTFEAAQQYCPPNCVHWYNNTTSQMALI